MKPLPVLSSPEFGEVILPIFPLVNSLAEIGLSRLHTWFFTSLADVAIIGLQLTICCMKEHDGEG